MIRSLTCSVVLLASFTAQAQLQTPHIQAINPPSLLPNDFRTVQIYGYGFNNSPTVRFNGKAQTTTLISTTLLEATFATPATPTAWMVTVTNNVGAASNAVPFSVAVPTPSIGLSAPFTEFQAHYGLGVGDFNGDGKLDVVTAQPSGGMGSSAHSALRVTYNNGDGTFSPQTYNYPSGATSTPASAPLVVADFNGDGLPDVALAESIELNGCAPPPCSLRQPALIVFLNNGSGFFAPSSTSLPAGSATAMATGNFTNSGTVDLAIANGNQVLIYKNAGNGLFSATATLDLGAPVLGLAAADFNQDGVSEFIAITATSEVIGFYVGGPLQYSLATISDPGGPVQIVLGDFNNDGLVDAAILGASSIRILQSAGNGNFTAYSIGAIPAGTTAIEAADFNSDGKIDLAVFGNAPYFLLNQGAGSWTPVTPNQPVGYYPSAILAAGPFSQDGKVGLAALDNLSGGLEVYSQAPIISFTPASFSVSVQSPQTSTPQTFSVNNIGSDPLILTSAPFVRPSGSGAFNIVSNGCTAPVAVGASCQMQVTYTAAPNVSPNTSQIAFLDNALGQQNGAQIYQLTGNNLVALSSLSGSLAFPSTGIRASANLTETVKNFGTEALDIGTITIRPGPNTGANDFKIAHNFCGTQLAAAASCQVVVSFTPSAEQAESASLLITDDNENIAGTIETVAITGTGAAPNFPDLILSGTSLSFGNVTVTHTSSTAAIILTNIGSQPVAFASIALTGANPTDFALVFGAGTCTYGSFSLAQNASCKVLVAFTPTAAGSRTAAVSLIDNNSAGSTQSIALSGTGTYAAPLLDIASPTGILLSNATGGFTLALAGANFGSASTVRLNGLPLTTSLTGGTIQATVPAGSFAAAGTAQVTVTNPGVPASNPLFLPIASSSVPAPGFFKAPGSPLGIGAPWHITVADFNGDGKPDMAVTTAAASVTIYTGNGDGTFTQRTVLPLGIVYPSPFSPNNVAPFSTATGDFNNDGKLDLAVFSNPNGVVIWLGNGDGTFRASAIDPQTGQPLGIFSGSGTQFGVTADFNGDGKLDLAVSNNGDGSVAILLGNGDGTFTASAAFGVGAGPWGIVAGDFNGDNIVDLAVANQSGGNVTVLLGNGSGGFTAQAPLPVGAGPSGLTAGDFNNDGKLDLAVTNANANSLSILLGNGNGTFTAAASPATGANPLSVAAADLNGDGKLDLAVANRNDNTVLVLLGKGDGTFASAGSAIPVGTNPYWVSIADWNNDGKLDLGVSNANNNQISILLSGATGTASLSATSLAFANQPAGVASAAQQIVLTNSGAGPLALTGIAVSGLNAADFTQTNSCGTLPVSIAAGGSCSVNVTFNPSVAGSEAAVLTFSDNSTQVVDLSGTGVVTVTVSAGPLSFGNVNVKTASAPQPITFTNNSAIPISITSISLSGGNAADFAQTNTCGISVAAGANCSISVVFTPSAQGVESAVLSIADSATGSPHTVSLGGTAVVTVTVSLSSVSFGAVAVKTGSPQSLDFTNTSTVPVAITAISFSGANAADFSQTNTCGTSVAPGAKCSISVVFTPSTTGAESAVLTIADNATGSPHTIPLSGTGIITVTVAPSTLSFGDQAAKVASAAQTVTLTNTSGIAASISTISFGGANAADFAQTNTCGTSLPAGASCSIAVVFTPSLIGIEKASLSIPDAAIGSPQIVALSGNGIVTITVAPLSVSFGDVAAKVASAPHTVTLSNTRAIAVPVTAITIGGPNAADFSQTNTCGASVPAGASCSIAVVFTPSKIGVETAALSIADPANGSPQTITLTGNGIVTVTVAPLSVSFGKVGVKIASAAQTVVFTNTSAIAVPIAGFTFTGPNSADFSQTNTCGSSVAADAICSINVVFTPSLKGSESARLSIADSAVGSPQTVALSGTGVVIMNVSPPSVNFGSVGVGASGVPQTIQATNTSGAPVAIGKLTFSGADAADFTQTNTCGTSLAGGATCSITIVFKSTEASAESAVLSIADDATNGPQTVVLSGTGAYGPVAALSAASLVFPATAVGTASAPQTITVSNVDAYIPIVILRVTATGAFSQTNNCELLLHPGASCSIAVTFKPAVAGPAKGKISILDDSFANVQAVTLAGTGH